MDKTRKVVAFLLALAVLAACGVPGSGGVALKEISDHWSATVAIENDGEAQHKLIFTNMSERFQALKIKYPLLDSCYANWSEAATEVVAGRYDTNAGSTTEPPSGTVNMPALINALVVTEDTPEGLELCNKQVQDYGAEVTTWRLSNIDLFAKLWDIKADLDGMYFGQIGRALAVQLLQYAGTEFMKTDLAAHFAPPKVWFPTFNLEASIYDRTQCDDFIAYYPGQALWNPAVKECKLIGQAAYDVIFRPVLAAEVRETINTGIDDLNPIGATPVP